jgi:hypothetical protein
LPLVTDINRSRSITLHVPIPEIWQPHHDVEPGICNVNLLKFATGFGIDAAELVTGLVPPEKKPSA